MPKSQNIDPNMARQAGWIKFTDIPVNQYAKTVKEEKKHFSKADFLRIYRDMTIIREFETMLNLIKTTNEYNGISYNHPGPAHLSIGQEASVVGQAYLLDKDDYIFGSHRSHGEILAKGLSAIEKLDDATLMDIMKNFFEGSILKVVEANRPEGGSVTELAIDFLVYGTLAEIFARETGFHKGLGGSMHAFLRRSASTRTTPSSVGRGTSPLARHSTRKSTAKKASSLPISGTRPWAAARFGKA